MSGLRDPLIKAILASQSANFRDWCYCTIAGLLAEGLDEDTVQRTLLLAMDAYKMGAHDAAEYSRATIESVVDGRGNERRR